jgi:fucose 4-O-acetylase-like acetyltransferase
MYKLTIHKTKIKERNVGLQILRMLLCFWVLLFHCLRKSDFILFKFIKTKKFHVPCFFFISFFYFYPTIEYRDSIKMKSRLERLFIPYTIWPIFTEC